MSVFLMMAELLLAWPLLDGTSLVASWQTHSLETRCSTSYNINTSKDEIKSKIYLIN